MHRIASILLAATVLQSQAIAQTSNAIVRLDKTQNQLIVHGKPYLIFGGELGNSSAGTASQADSILPAMAKLHLNTVLMPVAWDQIEPEEGHYDFSILDHWIDVARSQQMHLGLLWFGSWKNAFSEYAPAWIKSNTKRFPRALAADSSELEILSTFGDETMRADSRAFAALLAHVKEKDASEGTVLLVQVENEVGYLGQGRDRSKEAERAFASSVPRELMEKLDSDRAAFSPELAAHFDPHGKSWHEVFGDAANEVFMAWRYATYIENVAKAGKAQFALPMYVNAQLPAFLERAGDYPSGGPHPYYLSIYRAVAPDLDFYSPDIYWPEFAYWIGRYEFAGNPLFVPEARLEPSPYNALYAYGAGKAFGFCPFGIDSLAAKVDSEPEISQVYAALNSLGELLPAAQREGRTRGIVLYSNSARATQTVSLGGYLFQGSLSHAWGTNALLAENGAMLLLQSAPNEFLIMGAGLTVKMSRDPDADNKVAGIGSIEEVARDGAGWKVIERLNGDQSNQGRQLTMDPHRIRIYRLRLYAAE